MSMTQDHQKRIWALEGQLADVANLVAALEVVSWQLCQAEAQGEMGQLRDAVIGISRALDCEIRRWDLKDKV